jgi:hypothetical protein
MEFIDFAPLLGIPAVIKVIDAYRHLVTNQDWRAFGYTVGAWAVGVGVTYLVTQSSVDLPVGNWADVVLIGIGIGATGSVVHDATKRPDTVVELKTEVLPIGGTVDPAVAPDGIGE